MVKRTKCVLFDACMQSEVATYPIPTSAPVHYQSLHVYIPPDPDSSKISVSVAVSLVQVLLILIGETLMLLCRIIF